MSSIGTFFQSAKEYLEPVRGALVEGSLPDWLKGSVFRVGPGVFDLDGGFTVNTLMDGFAVVSKIQFDDGGVSMTQRILNSDAYTKAQICKKPVYAEFGTRAYPDTTKSIFKRMISTMVPTDLTDNNCGNVYVMENEVILASETCFVHSIDQETLLKKTKINYADYVSGTILMTSHPMQDTDGSVWNIAASAMPTCKYYVVQFPSTGSIETTLRDAKIRATISSSHTANLTYQHSFSMTSNYILFVEQPLRMSIIKMAQMGIKGNCVRDSFEWHPESMNKIHLIEKGTGKVSKTQYFTSEPYLILHYVNAFEDGDNIIVDALTYNSTRVLDKTEIKNLRNGRWDPDDTSRFCRFIVPVISDVQRVPENVNLVNDHPLAGEASAVRNGDKIVLTAQKLFEPGVEMQAINPNFSMKPYRYFYGTALYSTAGAYKNAIIKADIQTGETTVRLSDSQDEFFGEVYFVPRTSGSSDEEDGVLITPVCSTNPNEPHCVAVYDARDMKRISKIEFAKAKFSQLIHGVSVPIST